ncbi:MAG: DMT family transporter [Pseudomonadota bacterium]
MARFFSSSLATYAVLAVMPLMFSSNLVIGRAAADALSPATLAFWRWGLAFLCLIVLAAPLLKRHAQDVVREAPTFVVLGFLGMVICGTFVYASLHHTTATNATLIYTTSPIFIILLERIFRGRAFQWREWLGVILAIIGIAVVVSRGDLNAILSFDFNGGDLGILAAAISWAVYSVVIKKKGVSELPTTLSFCVIAGAGTLLIVPNVAMDAVSAHIVPQTISQWLSVLALAFVSALGAFGAYQYGIKRVGPATTGLFLYLLTPYGVLMSVLFLGERLQTFHTIGIVLSLGGVILATLPRDIVARTASLKKQ